MIKTLRLSFALRDTYRVNGILYSLKQIPLLKKLLPDTLYQVRGLKIFAHVLSFFLGNRLDFSGEVFVFVLYGVWCREALSANTGECDLFTFAAVSHADRRVYEYQPV